MGRWSVGLEYVQRAKELVGREKVQGADSQGGARASFAVEVDW